MHINRAETIFFLIGGNKMKKLHIFVIGCLFPISLWGEEGPIMSDNLMARSASEPKVVILNSQNQKTDQQSAHDQNMPVSNQPVVRVIGTPVSVSYAAELKRSRQDAELNTEQKIVAQLESARLRDEEERLSKLFGHKQSATTKVVVVPQTNTALQGYATPSKRVESAEQVYFGVQAGQSSNLTNVQNLNSYGSFGASMGVISKAGLILESSFFYSQHQLDIADKYNNNRYNIKTQDTVNVYQLSGLLALKYTPFSSRFKPYVGAFVSYNYWVYEGFDYLCHYRKHAKKGCHNYTKVDAVDVGPIVGMDMQLSHKVSIGFNLIVNAKNLYNNHSDSYYAKNYYDDYYAIENVQLEETNWLIASLNAKLYF